jgi:hypothetical protein
MKRRGFLKAAGLAGLGAGFSGCRPGGGISKESTTAKQTFIDNFDAGLGNWQLLNPGSWEIQPDAGNPVLVLLKEGKQLPPVRRPSEYALIRDKRWKDATITLRIKTLEPDEIKGRDVCILFGYVDDTHFYYAHLCSDTNGKSHNIIMKVSGAERGVIMKEKLPEVRLTSQWHTVRVQHRANGEIKVWMDDMAKPLMTAKDKDYQAGMIGVGSFDDLAMFDSVEVQGTLV